MLTPLNLLMIEDTESDAELALEQLEKAGFQVNCRRVEKAAAMQAALEQGAWDLVLCDYSLPGFNAPAALNILRESAKDIPLIVVSGTISEETAIELMRAGAADYLMKDRLARLGPLVRRELNIAQVRRERSDTQQALRESRELLNLIYNTTSDAMFLLAVEPGGVYRCLSANAAFLASIGRPLEEVIGRRAEEIIAPNNLALFMDRYQEAIQSGGPIRFEESIPSPNGLLYFNTTLTPIFSPKGTCTHLLGSAHEITGQKRVEQVRRDNELYLRTLLDTTQDGFWTMDLEGRIRDVNQAYCKMSGYSLKELVGKHIRDLNADASLASVAARMERIHRTGSELFETRHRRKDGGIFDVEISASFLDENGGRFISFCRDISARKRTEESLRQSEKRFSTAFYVSPDAISISRLSDGLFLEVNPGFAELSGYTAAEVQGKTSLQINIWENPQERASLVRGLVEKGEVTNLEALFHARDDSIKVGLVSARLIELDGVPCILSIVRDITDRKRAEEALRESETKLSAIITQSHDAIGVSNRGAHILVNPAYVSMFGYASQAEILEKTVVDLIAPPARAKILENIQRRARGEPAPEHYETRGLRKDGTEFDMEVTVSTYQVKNERYTVVGLRDITRQKRAQEDILNNQAALDRQNSLLKALFETLPTGILMVDVPSGKRLVANEAALRLLGLEVLPEDITNENLAEVYKAYKLPGRERYPIEEMPIVLAMRGISAHVDDMLVVRPDGSSAVLDVNGSPVVDPEGRIWASLISFQDITERRRAEAALRESEYFFKESQRAGSIGSYKTDFRVGTWESSEVLDQIFGIGPDYIRNIPGWLEIVHPSDRPRMKRYLNEEVIAKRLPFNMEYRILRQSDGETRWVHGLGETEFDTKGVSPTGSILTLIGTIQDISERKRAENLLNSQLVELRRWHAVTLGREKRILELKEEVNQLLEQAGQPSRYANTLADAGKAQD